MRFRNIIAIIVFVSGILSAVPTYACEFVELINFSPDQGETVSVTPRLEVSTGPTPSDPCGHFGTQWLIATDDEFTNIVHDVDSFELFHLDVPSGVLQAGQTYYWSARPFEFETEGDWSIPTGFMVASQGGGGSCEFVEVVNYYPEENATISTTTPTLEIQSGFVPDAPLCAHDYTRWVIASDPKFGQIVFDSGFDPNNLYKITIPSGVLSLGQSYYWSAQLHDADNESDFSIPTGFSISEIGGSQDSGVVEEFGPDRPVEFRRGPVLFPGASEPVIVNYAVIDGYAIFEGDIILGRVEMNGNQGLQTAGPVNRPQGIGIRPFAGNLWPGGVMAYTFAGGFSGAQQAEINEAMRQVSNASSITFVQRTTQTDYVEFTPGGGCSSYVGRIGGKQEIILSDLCGLGSTIHEILHALGIYHEQSRCDRDNFVRINFGNIRPGRENNFNNQCATGSDIGAYDFNSIMHYSALAFSANNLPTIETIPAGTPIGNRAGLSAGDIASIAALYGGGGPITPPAGNSAPSVDLQVALDTSTGTDILVFTANARDVDGDSLTYEWFLNGEKQLIFNPQVQWRDPVIGTHSVSVKVNDGRGNSTQDTISFNVTPGGGGPGPGPGPGPDPGTKSIEQALDTNSNGRLDDSEIQKAIEFWILGSVVPGTDNLTISDNKIRDLLRIWILGSPIPQSVAVSPPKPAPSFLDWLAQVFGF